MDLSHIHLAVPNQSPEHFPFCAAESDLASLFGDLSRSEKLSEIKLPLCFAQRWSRSTSTANDVSLGYLWVLGCKPWCLLKLSILIFEICIRVQKVKEKKSNDRTFIQRIKKKN